MSEHSLVLVVVAADVDDDRLNGLDPFGHDHQLELFAGTLLIASVMDTVPAIQLERLPPETDAVGDFGLNLKEDAMLAFPLLRFKLAKLKYERGLNFALSDCDLNSLGLPNVAVSEPVSYPELVGLGAFRLVFL